MDKCVNDIEIERFVAVRNIIDKVEFDPKAEMVPLGSAYGRVLAQDMPSKTTLPNHLTSARDGVAVYFDRFENGMPDTSEWKEGVDYIFSNTGIGIQGDYDTCVVIEKAQIDDEGRISFDEAPTARYQGTVPVGFEIQEGDVLAYKGQVLTPFVVAMLVRGGYTEIPCLARPRVAFIPTGNELVAAGAELPIGKNIDSNSWLVRGKLESAGALPFIYPIVPDDKEKLGLAIDDAIATADIVILNGGSSKGSDDFGHEVVDELATILNHQVNTGPGKHTMYAIADGERNVPIVGLSGPSAGCDFTFDWYVRPLIEAYFGRPPMAFPTMKAHALVPMSRAGTGATFMLASHVFVDESGQLVVAPADRLGDDKRIESRINGYVALAPGTMIPKGGEVDVELRWPFTAPVFEEGIAASVDDEPFIR